MKKKKEVCKGVFRVLNDRGLHTRPSTEIVKCAAAYKSEIWLKYQKQEVNAKSILGIMMLAAGYGAKITVRAIGEDAEEAVAALVKMAEEQFGMQY